MTITRTGSKVRYAFGMSGAAVVLLTANAAFAVPTATQSEETASIQAAALSTLNETTGETSTTITREEYLF